MINLSLLKTADILTSVFKNNPCDFCPEADRLTYTDPETGCHYCLPCLAEAAEAAQDMACYDALPEDPQVAALGREVIAARRAAPKGN